MKEIRPKINEKELELLIEAMKKAGFPDRPGDPRQQLYQRFKALSKGEHKKRRIH
jgi:hypothetical protein